MGRIGSFRFPRNITVSTLKIQPNDPLAMEGHDPRGLVQKIVRRAVCIWKLVVKYQNRIGDSVPAQVLDLPDDAKLCPAKSRERSGGKRQDLEE